MWRWVTVLALAGMFNAGITLPSSVVVAQETPVPALAQGESVIIRGRLDENSRRFDDGNLYDIYEFWGDAGDLIEINLENTNFEATLILLDIKSEELLAQSTGTSLSIRSSLLHFGNYAIFVIGRDGLEIEEYELRWQGSSFSREQSDLLSEAYSLNQEASNLYESGQPLAAEDLLLDSLNIFRELLGEQHISTALIINNLAETYRSQGRYWEAEPLFLSSLQIFQDLLGNHHLLVARNLNNLAVIYRNQGRYSEAEDFLLEAISIFQNHLPEYTFDFVISLSNLAEVLQSTERYQDAASLYAEALTYLAEQNIDDQSFSIATTILNNLAEVYSSQGRYQDAIRLHENSLNDMRRRGHENHLDIAVALSNLGSLYHIVGDYDKSADFLLESLEVKRKYLGEYHPSVAASFSDLILLSLSQNDVANVVFYWSEFLGIQEQNLTFNLAVLSDAQRYSYVSTISGTVEGIISTHLQARLDSPEIPQLALTTLLRRKGRVLDAGIESLQTLRQNLDSMDQALLDDFVSVRQQLATLTFQRPETLPLDQYRARLAELEAEANQLEAQLARRSATFRAETTPVGIDAVATQLPADSVLVEYGRYRPFDAQADPANRFGSPRYAAYLLFPDGRMEGMDLGDATEIDIAVLSLSDGLTNVQAVEEIQSRAQTLDALVMAPLRDQLEGVEHLLISPDGALNQIPFEVLRSASGQYLIETFEISYLTSGRDLLKLDLIPPSPTPAVILAAPNYGEIVAAAPDDNSQRSVDLASLTVNPLQYAFREGRALSALLPDADFLTGRSATETALKQVSSPRLLHIATHGLFLEDAPPSSGKQ